MKAFWTSASLLAVIAVGGWIYRDQIPYAEKLPVLGAYVHKPAAGGGAGGQGTGEGSGQNGTRGGGQATRTAATGDGAQAEGQGGQAGQGGNRRRNGGPPAVTTVAAKIDSLPMDAAATGWAEAEDTTVISTLQAGLVTDVVAKDGQDVKAGDLIVRLDDRMARAAVDKDRAMIMKDEATLAQAETALQRAAALVKQNAQSQQTYDQAKADRDSAAATLEADKATLASDLVALDHMHIRAPYDGRLGGVQVSAGAYVAAGASIVTITRYNPIYVRFSMSQRYLPQLHQLSDDREVPVDVDPASTGGVPVRGKLSFFDNTVDEASGTILVKAEFSNDKGVLWPGQSVNVTVRFTADDKSVIVPTVALRPGPDGQFVYRVDAQNKVHATKVTVLRSNGDMTALSGGLKEGDRVVVEGQSQLADGQTVVEQKPVADGTSGAAAGGKPQTVAENAATGTASTGTAPTASPAKESQP